MMKKIYPIIFAFGFSSFPHAVQAQAQAQAPSPVPQTSYAQLAALNDQIALLKAQVQVAQLQQELAVASHTTIMNQDGAPPLSTSDLTQNTPHILAISGRGKDLRALVQMPVGDEMMVLPGSILSDGAIVRSITPQSVIIFLNNQVLSLPFARQMRSSLGAP